MRPRIAPRRVVVDASLVAMWFLEELYSSRAAAIAEHWAVSVSGNWRLTFKFEGEDAVLVDYQDYH